MKILIRTILPICIFLLSSQLGAQDESIEKWKKEIVQTENDFAEMAKTDGISKAFLHYAAEGAVLKQENTLHIGKEAIAEFYKTQPLPPAVSLTWTPDFVDVSKSGDLGYTYGYYILSYPGPEGKTVENKGVFHTVWKRQADGTWKFVWD